MRPISTYRRILTAALLAIVMTAVTAAQVTVTVTNAATFVGGFPLSPGCWATGFADFGAAGILVPAGAGALPFPTTLGGMQVLVNDVAAPLSFVGPTQVNFLIPGATSQGRASLKVTVSGMSIYEGAIQIFPISPGLLSLNPAEAAKPGAVLNGDSTVNSEANPAAPGEVIVAYGIGADFAELPADGAAAPLDRLIETSTNTTAYISVAEAQVNFSGMAPGLVNAWQINAVVPDQTFVDGQVTFQAEISGLKTNLVSFWVAR